MNKSESKYFNTAVKMDKAFLMLLDRKDFEYITVKEICETAGVNRSTFYLHYENIGDLLSESVSYMLNCFFNHMNETNKGADSFVTRIKTCPLSELYLITPEYLTPYLCYVKDNKRIIKTSMENAAVLQLEKVYMRMFIHVFVPILERYNVVEHDRKYLMAFYIRGIMAIVEQWLKDDCADSVEYIVSIIQRCVKRSASE